MRLVFAGSPAAAVPSLRALAESRHDVVGVLTRDDTPQGRKKVLTATPVALEADALGIPVIKTRRITDDVTAQIAALEPDLGVIVAYGALLRQPLLGAPRLGWINLHFSLLPRWRGAAPVQRALIAGDEATGAAVFQLVPELDAGVVYGTVPRDLGGDETTGDLLRDLARTGALLLENVVDDLADGTAVGVPQEGEVTLAPKLTLDDGRLEPRLGLEAVYNRFRGVTPEPGAFVVLAGGGTGAAGSGAVSSTGAADGAAGGAADGSGAEGTEQRLKVLEARRGDSGPGAPAVAEGRILLDGRRALLGTATTPLELVTVQPAGKKPMAAADWVRGVSDRDALRAAPPAGRTVDGITVEGGEA